MVLWGNHSPSPPKRNFVRDRPAEKQRLERLAKFSHNTQAPTQEVQVRQGREGEVQVRQASVPANR